MTAVVQDLRYALRQLRRSPGFSAVAIVTLALGIGLNSAIFRLVDAVVLRELPVKEPRQLVFPVVQGLHGADESFPYPEFESIRDRSQSLSGVFAFDTTRFLASLNGQTDYLFGQSVSANFFSVLGVAPVMGRAFVAEDNQAGHVPTAVISYDYWERRFAGDPGVLNQSISLKKIPFRIVGVAPPAFRGIELGDAVDIWIPMLYWPQVRLADHLTVGIMGRLKSGLTVNASAAELNVIDRQYVAQTSSSAEAELDHRSIQLRSGARGLNDLPDELPHELNLLLAVTGFVLLIACANVANLQLGRSISRTREIATRLALGASRMRLMRHLALESLILAVIGGGIGFLLAHWASSFLLRFVMSGSDAVGLDASVDARVVLFSAVVAILSGLLFGMAPALGVLRTDAAPNLQASGRAALTGDRSKHRLSQSLLVMQIALCVALLVGTGLMVRSLRNLSRVHPGFSRDHILLAFLYPTLGRYEGARELNLYSTLQEKVEAAPGVLSASISRFPLLSGGGGWRRSIDRPGTSGPGGKSLRVHCNPVSPQFFATMGIPLIVGRDFTAADGATAPKVVIISEALARAAFPNQNAIGRQVQFTPDSGSSQAEVVGIVKDVRSYNLRASDDAAGIYVPVAQAPPDLLGQAVLEVRAAGHTDLASASVRRVMQSIDGDFPLARISSQAEQTSESLGGERSLTFLLGLFSALAVVLASVGLYGVIAHATARRTREIGIRVALGARREDVLRMIVGQGVKLTMIGVGAGLVTALAGARALASQLFGVTSADPLTFAGAAVFLAAVALSACYLPARRAAGVDPVVALRNE